MRNPNDLTAGRPNEVDILRGEMCGNRGMWIITCIEDWWFLTFISKECLLPLAKLQFIYMLKHEKMTKKPPIVPEISNANVLMLYVQENNHFKQKEIIEIF